MFKRLVVDGEVEVSYRRMNRKTIIDSQGDYIMGEPERVAETGEALVMPFVPRRVDFPVCQLSHPRFLRGSHI